MVELVIRLVFSLAVVVGLLLVMARFSGKRLRGRADALVRVVHRQALSRGSSVAVVTVGSRILVIGTTEQQVQLLTELDPDELDLPLDAPTTDEAVEEVTRRIAADTAPLSLPAPGASATPAATPAAARVAAPVAAPARRSRGRHAAVPPARRPARAADGALAGSVLSAETWRQALAAATSKQRAASTGEQGALS